MRCRFSLPGDHMRTAGWFLYRSTYALTCSRMLAWTLGFVKSQSWFNSNGISTPMPVARSVVQRDGVELPLEPAFDGVDAQPPHVGEIALVQGCAIACRQRRVL